jgi:hypothetical protein
LQIFLGATAVVGATGLAVVVAGALVASAIWMGADAAGAAGGACVTGEALAAAETRTALNVKRLAIRMV